MVSCWLSLSSRSSYGSPCAGVDRPGVRPPTHSQVHDSSATRCPGRVLGASVRGVSARVPTGGTPDVSDRVDAVGRARVSDLRRTNSTNGGVK